MRRCSRRTTKGRSELGGRALWAGAIVVLAALAMSCAAPPPVETPAPVTARSAGPTLRYEFTALDGSKISSDASLGRNTVIAFLTSYGGASQAQARFLASLAHDHVPRTNCYAIFTERSDNRPLVELFVQVLNLRIPAAQVEYADLKGGPFADVVGVPTVFILDRGGHIVWRKVGVATQDELERQLAPLE